jgi:hypothetical protein
MGEPELSFRQEMRIDQAAAAGIPPQRIAELVGCIVEQVLASLETMRQLAAERDAWEGVLAAEKAKLKADGP